MGGGQGRERDSCHSREGCMHYKDCIQTGVGGWGGVEDRALWSFFGIINIQLVTMNIQLGRDLQRGP